jgi:parallel beta-helix repeat protein
MLALPTPAAAATLYVATTGNDHWSGTLDEPNLPQSDGPFATLGRARDELRKLRAAGVLQGESTVWVRGGSYPLSQTFTLDAQDGGNPQAPIIYRAYGKEQPILTGGRAVTGFTPYKGEILRTDVAAQGLKGIYFRQLLFAGQRQPLARYPNYDPQNPYGGGWSYVDGKFCPMYSEVPGEDKHTLHFKAADARTWSRPEEGEVFIFPRFNWWNNIVGIKSIDAENHTITLRNDCSYAIRPNDRYYVQNLLEELDAPGEWYLDGKDSTLYFWPPSPLADQSVSVPVIKTILELGPGTAHVTFRGFTFECCEETAIKLNQTTDCLIAGNIIRNVGGYNGAGISVNGGLRNGVVGNDIYGIGRSGITIDGGDRQTLTPAENYADNNYIHHIGVAFKQGVGIELNGCGNRASHNLIHDGPRMGIMFSGNNLLIEYNHIRHVNLETEDTGAVYTGGRDWISSRGTVVRYNYFHDILGYGQKNGKWISPYFAWGVYLDDNAGGVDIIGNIIARCTRAGLHLHNGRDNLIQNNIFIETGQMQVEYDGWTATNRMWLQHYPTMIKGYASVANQPAWKNMRNMQVSPDQAILPNGMVMTGNQVFCNIFYYLTPQARLYRMSNVPFDHNAFDYNLIFHGGLPLLTGQKPVPPDTEPLGEWKAWQALGADLHSVVADPLLVDPAHDDYRLRPDSPAFSLGFKAIPVEKIGPYADDLRASWPIVEAEGAREHPANPPGSTDAADPTKKSN